jgi:hypothetical protein
VSVQESWLGLTRSVYRGASNAVHVDALTKDLQVLDPDLQVRLFLSSTFTDTILERNLLMAMVWPEVSRLVWAGVKVRVARFIRIARGLDSL